MYNKYIQNQMKRIHFNFTVDVEYFLLSLSNSKINNLKSQF